MTERVYYTDSYAQEFAAAVTQLTHLDGQAAVILDRTCFYPESGGQPYDTGFLGSSRVTAVMERNDEILHFLAGEAPLPGSVVQGRIDWSRRFRFMQQHTGQHILSQAFLRLAGAETVSSHLGEDDSTIDLSIDEMTPELLESVETEANRVVFEDRYVAIRFLSPEEAHHLSLRKLPERSGSIRIIDIEGYDVTACGGTHCRRTGEVGLILVCGQERVRRKPRIHFVCGFRALELARRDLRVTNRLSGLLSSSPDMLVSTAERLLEQNEQWQRRSRELEEKYLSQEARSTAVAAEMLPGRGRLACKILSDADPEGLQRFAALAIAEAPDLILVAAASVPGAPVLLTRGPDAPQVDLRPAFELVRQLVGGRGGGSPQRIQGGGGDPQKLPAALQVAVEAVKSAINLTPEQSG